MIDTPAILAADRAKFEEARGASASKNAKAAAAFEIGQNVRNRPGSIIGKVVGFEGTSVVVEVTAEGRVHAVGEIVKVSPTFLKAN